MTYVYIQGNWKAKLVRRIKCKGRRRDLIVCVPLEGINWDEKGKEFTFAESLIETKKRIK